ncbi:hypothetical protein GCM10010306_059540 [Streptomyces umbrinus]|nr:hypothetical protein GCM10010306_059540 [Streptomyces umbrinus]
MDLSAGFVRDGCRPAAPVGARRQEFRAVPIVGADAGAVSRRQRGRTAPRATGSKGPHLRPATEDRIPPQAGDGASELDLRWLARRVAVPAPGHGTLPGQGTGRLKMERR